MVEQLTNRINFSGAITNTKKRNSHYKKVYLCIRKKIIIKARCAIIIKDFFNYAQPILLIIGSKKRKNVSINQVAAINFANSYLMRVKQNQILFSETWLFGSDAKGTVNDSRDNDLSTGLDERVDNSFETELSLMLFREGEETMIEPHAFSKAGFDESLPVVKQNKRALINSEY